MSVVSPAQVATRLLLQQRLNNLQFDITRLIFDRPILFDSIQHYCSLTTMRATALTAYAQDGLTIVHRRGEHTQYIVLWNEKIFNLHRKRFTLAHEIGHIYLGHADDGIWQETQADAFAAQLLLPRILVEQVVQKWGEYSAASELCQIFRVSRSAALRAIDNLHTPIPYTTEDDFLLQRFAPLLTAPDEPLISV